MVNPVKDSEGMLRVKPYKPFKNDVNAGDGEGEMDVKEGGFIPGLTGLDLNVTKLERNSSSCILLLCLHGLAYYGLVK